MSADSYGEASTQSHVHELPESKTPEMEPESLPKPRYWEEDRSRPRPRRKPALKSSATPVIVGILILLVIGGLIGAFIWLGGDDTAATRKAVPCDKSIVALIPANTKIIIGYHVGELVRVKKWQSVGGDFFDGPEIEPLRKIMNQSDIGEADLESLLITSSATNLLQIAVENTVIIKLKQKNFDPAIFKQVAELQEVNRNGKVYLRDPRGRSYYLASNQLLVMSTHETTIQQLLEKGAGQMVASQPLQDLAERGGGMPFWIATTDAGLVDTMMAMGKAGFGGLGGEGGNNEMLQMIKTSKGVGIFYEFTPTKLNLVMAVLNDDTAAVSRVARKGSRDMKEARRHPDEMRREINKLAPNPDAVQLILDVVESAELSATKDRFEMAFSMSMAPFERMEAQMGNQFNPLGGGR